MKRKMPVPPVSVPDADDLPDLVWRTDAEDRYVFVGSRCREVWGLSPAEVLGRRRLDMVRPFPGTTVDAGGGAGFSGRLLLAVRADGCETVVESSGRPRIDAQGVFAGFSGIDRIVTGRVRRERALEDSNERYRLLMDQAANSMLVIAADGRLIDANRKVQALTGFDLSTLLTMTYDNLAVPGEEDKLIAAFRSLKRPGDVATFETVSRRQGGGVVPVQVVMSLMELKGERVVQAIVHDISELKAAQEAQARHVVLLQTLIDSIPMPVFYKDETLVYRGCNRGLGEFLDIPRDKIIGRTVFEIAPPDLAEVYHAADLDLMHTARPQVYESRVPHADGSDHDIVFHKATFPKPDGSPGGVIGVMVDITRRKAAEAELREQEERVRLLLEATSEGIFSVDLQCVCTMCNGAAAAMLGFERAEQVLGLDLQKVIRGGETKGARSSCVMAAGISDGRPVRVIDEVFHRRDGSRFPVEYTVSPLRRGGELIGAVVVFSDSSERRRLEAQLLQALKMESLGTLAAGIAHEINTPIQYVGDNLTYIEQSLVDILRAVHDIRAAIAAGGEAVAMAERLAAILEECDVDFLLDELPDAIGQAREGVRHVAHIVQSMKEFSHPGMSAKVATDINHLVANTLVVTTSMWKHVARVEQDLAADLPMVACYPADINQVLLNLIVNAAQAIESLHRDHLGTIRVSTRRVGTQVEIRVADDGPGVAPGNRGKIFDPFFTTKEAGKGTGQGLAISFDIVVQRHGGTIELADGETGAGATFIVRLPVF